MYVEDRCTFGDSLELGLGRREEGSASLDDMARLGGSYRPAVVELLFSSPARAVRWRGFQHSHAFAVALFSTSQTSTAEEQCQIAFANAANTGFLNLSGSA